MADSLKDLREKLMQAKESNPPARERVVSPKNKKRKAVFPKIEKEAKEFRVLQQDKAQETSSKILRRTIHLRKEKTKHLDTETLVKVDKPHKLNQNNPLKVEDADVVRNTPPKLQVVDSLPVGAKVSDISKAIEENQVVIVSGETGSGKTTQLPKIVLQLGRGQKQLIGHTQPRRIAATSIAKRISEEMDTKVGEVVGYQIRFKDEMQKGASVKLMTDGILLNETQHDPLLKAYDTIIIDEAHERSLNIDFLLGYLKQILPKRPDLKLIITSATIDSARFAKHFESVNKKPVPVINVSGRLYPVQIRYRPILDEEENDDRTMMQAIVDACEELMREGPGDILVFLPGEREIRESSDALSFLSQKGIEVLPLFSRLSMEEQDKIFHKSAHRRIVLATNIAETSLTVPGIRYVVDTGLARVKRYSYRNKVEQLQIEKISQAAAKQRAGRCGRVANGICIRLYDEEDFENRDQYTDPEILRSSLATVILRMKSLRLSDVREFPFVESPPPRAISDGYDLLVELNAVSSRGGDLTAVGKQLAHLPLDVRLSRMLQAANENQALAEALVITAAMSIQDPRERPLEAQEQADQAHKKFAEEKSDFLSWMKLWNWMQEANANKQSNRLLEQKFKQNFLSVKHLREWRDVYKQLKELVQELGWRINTVPATYEQLHAALLAGLLSNVGLKDGQGDYRTAPYLGARGIRFWPWPGSSLSKKSSSWVVAAEIVETSRLFARTLGNVEPEWIEKTGAHLLKKSWSEPHWEKTVGYVVAYEKATLYGVPVYSQRRVDFSKKDPNLAREIFIRQGLVEEQLEIKASFWVHNQRLIREIRDMEHKSRRPDVLVDEESIFEFYDKRIPADVVNVRTLQAWLKTQDDQAKSLYLRKEDLMRHDASGITIEYFPKKLEIAGVPMALTYNFDPGSPRDGVTLTVPLFALNQVDEEPIDWLVPGMLKEKVHLLLKSLPQRFRRHFVPLPEWAKNFALTHERPSGSLVDKIIDTAREQFRIDIKKEDFKFEQLPPHLSMNYKVVDEHGRQLAMSRSLPQLRSELGVQAREKFKSIAEKDTHVAEELAEEITEWNFGELPDVMEIKRKGLSLIGHPALVDKGEYCSLEVFDDPDQALKVHKKGLTRLIRLELKEQLKYLDKNLKSLQGVQIQASSLPIIKGAFPSFEELKNEVVNAIIASIAYPDTIPNNEESFNLKVREVKEKLNLLAMELVRLLSQIISEVATAIQKLNALKGYEDVREDIEDQLEGLFAKSFVTLQTDRLKNYPRYLKAIQMRLDRLRNDPRRDKERMEQIHQLEIPYKRELVLRRGVPDPKLSEFGYLLEELRVSLFAQELRTPVPVSVKRLIKMWEVIKAQKIKNY